MDVPNLRIGDVVYLRFPECLSAGMDFTPTLSQGLEGPLSDLTDPCDFSFSLFQIVPFIPPAVLSNPSLPEYKAYQDEVKDLYQKPLYYGAEITLRHVFSSQLLYVDTTTASDQINTWRVSVGRATSRSASTLIRITPLNSSSEDGKEVSSSAAVNIDFVCGRITLSLRVSKESSVVNCGTNGMALNLSLYDEELRDMSRIKFMYPVTIRHAKLGECLTLDPKSRELRLRPEASLDAYWICESEIPNSALLNSDMTIRLRHAFYPVYMLQSGGITDSPSPTDASFSVIPCSSNTSTSTIEDSSGVFLQTQANKRLTIPVERMDEFLLTKFLPYPASLDLQSQAITEVEIVENATNLIFEVSHVSEEHRETFMEVKTMLATYLTLLSTLQQCADGQRLPREVTRVQQFETEVVSAKAASQVYSDMLVAFGYHRIIFDIVCGLAVSVKTADVRVETLINALINSLVKSLRVLVKSNMMVAEYISGEAEKVKDLIKNGYLSAGKLYCTIIRESQSIAPDVNEFCKQWFSELDSVGEESTDRKNLYLKMLISACKSTAGNAREVRKCVAGMLARRELIRKRDIEESVGSSEKSPFSKYVSRVLLLYSALYREFEGPVCTLLHQAGLDLQPLSELVNTGKNQEIRKACGVLRANRLISPYLKFLEEKDANFLSDLTLIPTTLDALFPYSIGKAQGLDDMAEEVWRTLIAPQWDKEDVQINVLEMLELLLEQLHRAKDLINECEITDVFLYCLRVSLSALLWAFGSVPSTSSPKNPLKVFLLIELALKSSKDKVDSQSTNIENTKIKVILPSIFSAGISLYSLICKLKLHKDVDLVLSHLYQNYGQGAANSDKVIFADQQSFMNFAVLMSETVLKKDEIALWRKFISSKEIDDQTEESKYRAATIDATLTEISQFASENDIDRGVIWTLLNSQSIAALHPSLRPELEALLLTLFYPKRVLQTCLQQSVFVKGFIGVKTDLESIVKTLNDNMAADEMLNEVFKSALIRVCNLLLVQLKSKEFTKTQAIMRNLQLHKALAPYLAKASESKDNAEIRTLCATFMYRFVSGNKLNKEALLRAITKPVQFWETRQFMLFVNETVDLSDVPLGDIYKMTKRVLGDLLNSNAVQYSQYILIGLLFDRDDEPYPERQHILSRMLLATDLDTSDPRRKSVTFKLLAKCGLKNESVVSQCRVFCPLAKLMNYVRKEYDPAILLEYIAFVQCVYLQISTQKTDPTGTEYVTDILRTAWDRAYPFSQDIDRFRAICEAGRYTVVRCYSSPYKRELAYSQQQADSFLSAWNLISFGSNRLSETGLLKALEDAGRLLKFKDERLVEFFSQQLVYELISLSQGVREMERDFDVSMLLARIQATFSVVQGVLGNPSSICDAAKQLTGQAARNPNFLHMMKNVGSMRKLINVGSKPVETEGSLSSMAEEVKNDQKLDDMVRSFADAFKKALQTKHEIAKIVEMWRFDSWAEVISKYTGLKSLLYKSHRVAFFNIMRDLVSTPGAVQLRSELFDIAIHNECLDTTIDAILRGKNKKVQCAALRFLSELVSGLEPEGFEKLKSHLIRTRKVSELFMFFYSSISALTARIQTRTFQATLSDASPADDLSKSKRISRFLRKQTSLVIEILKFIRTACDNLNTTWQSFFHSQENSEGDVDLLSEITKLVSAQGRYSRLSVTKKEARVLIVEGLNALIELTSGSENTNADIVTQEVSLFPALNSMFEEVFEALKPMSTLPSRQHTNTSKELTELSQIVSVFQSLSQLLLALTEQAEPKYDVFDKYLRLDMLLTNSIWLHEHIIEVRMSELVLGKDFKFVEDLVASAIYVRIFLVKMSKLTPCPAKLLTLISPVADCDKAADEFYSKYTGTVEITDEKAKIVKMYFPIPFKCHFLTRETFEELVMQPADKPHDEKLETLLKQREMCKDEMEHQQKMSENEMQKFVTKLWQVYGHISIILLVIINAMLILFLKGDEILGKFTEQNWVRDYLRFFGFLQFVMGVSSYICHFLEYLPSNTKNYEEGQSFSFQEFCRQQDNASLLEFEKLHQKSESPAKPPPPSSTLAILLLCFRPKSFYFLFYLTFSLLGFIWYIAYPVLMLDCIRRFGSLSRLLRAITSTWQQLTITLAFETIIVYVFAIVGFLLFKEYYVDDDGVLNCATLFNCFLSTMKTGLTQGGIGGELAPTSNWHRMTFDMTFWALVIVVMLNITFGIIIDSYSGLREDYRLMIEMKDGECFVCGENRSNIESHGESWASHIEVTHSLRTYIFLFVYLCEKDTKECSGLEKTVKNKIEKYDTTFFPHALEDDEE